MPLGPQNRFIATADSPTRLPQRKQRNHRDHQRQVEWIEQESGALSRRSELQGGAVVTSAQSHAIYMNRNGTCTVAIWWGDPEGFLRDFGQSDRIHVVDQYVGATASGRYSVGARVP